MRTFHHRCARIKSVTVTFSRDQRHYPAEVACLLCNSPTFVNNIYQVHICRAENVVDKSCWQGWNRRHRRTIHDGESSDDSRRLIHTDGPGILYAGMEDQISIAATRIAHGPSNPRLAAYTGDFCSTGPHARAFLICGWAAGRFQPAYSGSLTMRRACCARLHRTAAVSILM